MAAALVWFLLRVGDILWLFAIGFIIAWTFDPLLDRLERKGWSRGKAVGLVAGGVVLVGLLALAFIVPALVGQAQSLATNWNSYSEAIDKAYVESRHWIEGYVEERFPDYDVMPYLDAKVDEVRTAAAEKVPQLLGMVTNQLVRSVSFTGLLAVVAIITIHFMLIIDPFRAALRKLVPEDAGSDVDRISRDIGLMLGQFLRGQVTMMVAAGVIATLLMLVPKLTHGTQYALVVGLVTGITYIIPWVGAAASAILGAILSYVSATHDPVWAATVAALMMMGTNQICDQLIMPRVIGRQVGLHPLAVIFGILAGYNIMGFVGMMIAAPAVASVKIILARWLPLKQVETRGGKPPPLLFDLSRAMELARGGVTDVTRRIESAIGIGSDQEAPDELDQEDAAADGNQGTDSPATP